jgi:hypothetical protein
MPTVQIKIFFTFIIPQPGTLSFYGSEVEEGVDVEEFHRQSIQQTAIS